MANEEHLKILKRGAEAWNAWRNKDPEVQPDLSEAVLSGAHLRKADLSGADLGGADLREASLTGANLSRADLNGADLSGADLNGANLSGANLRWANLSGANLSGANLSGANLRWANLRGADLRGAWLSGARFKGTALANADFVEARLLQTVFADCDLSEAKGLATCNHGGPSWLDPTTLLRSKNLPEVFLRGVGVPEIFLTYLPSMRGEGEAIQFYSCFISYSSQNEAFAKRLHADLQAKDVRCWFAPEDLKIGDKFRVEIDEAIRFRDKLLIVLSAESLKSAWVEKEVESAFEEERRRGQTVLFPIRLDDAVMTERAGWAADIRRTRHIGDFSRWKEHDAYQAAFDRLLRDLKKSVESPTAPAP